MATINGTDGDDTLNAGQAGDVLNGLDGNDTLTGGDNGDTLFGGNGEDSAFGGNGQDVLDGAAGDDLLDGGGSNDTIFGGEGRDDIFGGGSDDALFGGAGDDTIDGGGAQDVIDGGDGNDVLIDGDDGFIKSTDTLFGGAGDDFFVSGGNNDQLFGGDDSDTFTFDPFTTLNQVFVDGGEGGVDQDTLNLTSFYQKYPDLEVIYEEGGPGLENGRIFLRGGPNGPELGRITYRNIENIICFTPGTAIATPSGQVAAEKLRVGDKVFTRDNGIQEIAWIGGRKVSRQELVATPKFNPVMVRKGSLGAGVPERDLVLSPNHRLLMTGQNAELHFNETEVLAAAKHLTHIDGIDIVEAVNGVEYIHIMFAQHEVILSNGSWTESFQPGDQSLRGVGKAQRKEIYELFPDLETIGGVESYGAARTTLRSHEAKLLS